ncbi:MULTISPECIES: crotonase/enoyl-CoA hydratase family protein [unclassified Shewanella]|uniref:crotonase/enoyl-CoA hydratase family protein n=1 Tax=unclassified Shewanella TaxID=196818 RepID=UPI000C839428|nr:MULTISPECIES: crotonase/enoyl-CoA hydratase family protein [unclassified Shewanella]MDO6641629.1 crotonase/enoyl-CoA hydratase family protein [Shewanella sp. 5_MG-2023]MDO6679970.1 crotonase/enoyl-CoA hydratase family protein [Shewanella sp. 4_MG-2023]MDO6775667.1 crotonase/enoyl-CoA hydratase family protein [Shewanella sp. 3_MG-2023]PMG28466.1 enoyl-CoA hydratase [Shewanella sp. 10N.286.52.C2]PMG39925.1 enoyl-CoA hydratase [Shewanella sp. 10N.286.52.B9]
MNNNEKFNSLTVEVNAKIAHIKLNRPDEFNSMNIDFWDEFPKVIQQINDQAAARVIVISSTGKHFCAGMDLAVFTQSNNDKNIELGRKHEQLRRLVLRLQECFNVLESARMPVLMAVQGGCIGGAVDMVSAADCRYCTSDAFFSIEETKLGMTADLGTLQRLPKLISMGLVKELAYTGRRMPANEAKDAGLVNQVFEDQQSMLTGVMAIAAEIAARSPLAVAGCKEMINYGRDHSVADSLNYMAAWQSGMFQPQNDMMETFTAKAQKRAPEFQELTPIDNSKIF